jgi:D-alanine-D-alanine ligase-like ATP-grasp enzyme
MPPSASRRNPSSIGTAAIAEQYIDGRELYVGVIGNERLRVLPIWELEFGDAASRIATERLKFNVKYQETRGILQGPAEDMPPELEDRIVKLTRRICHTLELDGYARIDLFHRGQSQSGNLALRSVRRCGGVWRADLFGNAQPHSHARHSARPRAGCRLG